MGVMGRDRLDMCRERKRSGERDIEGNGGGA